MVELNNDEYLSRQEAAEILQLSSPRISVLCKQGRFEGAIKLLSNWLIPRVSVENFKRRKPGEKIKNERRNEQWRITK